MKHQTLLALLVFSLGFPAFASAQDQPAIYRGPPEELRVQDMTSDERQERYDQYKAGKRDARDGYIILNQILFRCGFDRASMPPWCLAFDDEKRALLKAHPEFNNLQDFRLSDAIRSEEKKNSAAAKRKATMLERYKNWTPPDDHVTRILIDGNRAIVRYQFRLLFYSLPKGISLGAASDGKLNAQRDGKDISISSLKPQKELTFRRKVDMEPGMSDDVTGNVLVCTNLLTGYAPNTDQERRIARELPELRSRFEVKESGEIDQICGVISFDGKVVFEFPLKQADPGNLLFPLRIRPDGKRAAVVLGERVHTDGYDFVGNLKEVWIWEYPDKLKKIPVNDPKVSRWALRDKFYEGGL